METNQQQLSEDAKQKLEKNSELWREKSEFVRLEDGETRVLKFNPEQLKIVEGQFGLYTIYRDRSKLSRQRKEARCREATFERYRQVSKARRHVAKDPKNRIRKRHKIHRPGC
jgi:hypothetical protein